MLAPAPCAFAGDPFWGIRRTTDVALLEGGRQAPLEPNIGVGPDRIVQTANFRIACYTRTGAVLWKSRLAPEDLTSWSAHKFWAGMSTEGAEDSKVVYDQFSGRFVVSTMGVQTRELFIAISKDSAPANADSGVNGAWDKFVFPVGLTGGPFTGIFHWPQLAVSEHWIWVTGWLPQAANSRHVILALRRPPAPPRQDDPPANYFELSGNKLELLWDGDGADPTISLQTSQPAPAHGFGSTSTDTTYFIQRWGCNEPSGLATIRLSAVTMNSDATIASLARAELTSGTCNEGAADGCRQLCPTGAVPGAHPHLNVQNAVRRGDTIHFGRVGQRADGYGSRWVALWSTLTLNGWPHSGQQPTVATATFDSGRVFDVSVDSDTSSPVHHIYPCVMPTDSGGMALFTTRVVQTGFIDLIVTGRRPADPPAVLGAPVRLIQPGQAGVTAPGRWGDYEGIALDPTDGARVWITGTVGRCPTPSQADAECPTCLQPNPPPACFAVDCFSSAVGSHIIPDKPIRTLTIVRDPTNPPPAFTVKLMPMSIDGDADQLVTSAAPYARRFGHGTTVTLMVGRDYDEFYTFSKWIVDGDEVAPPPGAHYKVITVVMDQDRTASPVFKD
ncbi:MAG: hypothetical protein AB7Q17_08625 [Phycisphaerae bacterium]